MSEPEKKIRVYPIVVNVLPRLSLQNMSLQGQRTGNPHNLVIKKVKNCKTQKKGKSVREKYTMASLQLVAKPKT